MAEWKDEQYKKVTTVNSMMVKTKTEHTFEPFEKILVRVTENDKWKCDFFSHLDDSYDLKNPYCTIRGLYWKHCIPYEGNEHLLGTTITPGT